MDKKPKLLIIGIDGASYNLVSEYMHSGLLPNLKKIASTGIFCRLISTVPPITPVAWTTMMTGCNPGKHGIYYFVQGDPDCPQVVNRSHIRVPTIWEVMDKNGLRAGLFNIPWTFPPLSCVSFCVSGMESPKYDERMFYPPDLYNELEKHIGKYSLNSVSFDGKQYNIKELFKQINLYTETARYLARKYWQSLDAFMMVFMQVDHVQHKLWEFGPVDSPERSIIADVVKETYQFIDQRVGDLLDEIGGDDIDIVILSDHGFTASRGILKINNWLAELGLLSFSNPRSEKAAAPKRGYLALRRIFQGMPESWKNRIRRKWWMPSRRREYLITNSAKSIDWSKTKAFCAAEFGAISINLKSRYHKGIVAEQEVEEIFNLINSQAEHLIDPQTGLPIIEKVRRREELFEGPHVEEFPEFWLQSKGNGYYFELGWLGREIKSGEGTFSLPPKGHGIHHPEGIMIIKGSKIRKLDNGFSLQMQDISPTLLYLLGIEPPEYMDGKVRMELFREPVPVKATGKQYSFDDQGDHYQHTEEDQRLIEERLKDLGYL